jgi:hypothetical protein
MNLARRTSPSRSQADSVFDKLVQELVDKLQAGDAVDVDDYRCRYPEQAEKLKQLIPAVQLMADLVPSRRVAFYEELSLRLNDD